MNIYNESIFRGKEKSMKKGFFIFLCVLCFLLAANFTLQAAQNVPDPACQLPPGHEDLLCEMSPQQRKPLGPYSGYQLWDNWVSLKMSWYYSLSPARDGVLWVDKSKSGSIVRLNEKAMGPPYDDVTMPTFSADGQHLIFIGKRERFWHVVIDGQEGAQPYRQVNLVFLSADGKRSVVLAKRDGKTYVLVNGQEQPDPYDIYLNLPNEFVVDSPGKYAQHFVLIGWRAGKWRTLVDGKENDAASEIKRPVRMAPDGTLSAWVSKQEEGPWQVIVDGAVRAESKREISRAAVSHDGKQLVYTADAGSAGYVLVTPDGSTVDGLYDPKDGDSPRWLQFLGQSTHWIAVVQLLKDSKWHYVVDGTVGPPADVLGDFRSTPDGAHWTYGGALDPPFLSQAYPVAFVVFDGQEVLRAPAAVVGTTGVNTLDVRGLADLQPMIKDLLYRVSDPQRVVTYETGESRAIAFIEELEATPPGSVYRSWQGKRYIRVSWNKRARTISVDGQFSMELLCESIPLLGFSPDDLHWAGLVVKAKDDKRSFVILDGREGKHYDEILVESFSIDSSAGVRFIARDGLRFFHVEQPWGSLGPF